MLPLEPDTKTEEKEEESDGKKVESESDDEESEEAEDGDGESSELVGTITKKDVKQKKRKSTPTEDFLANYAAAQESKASEKTTASPIELLILKELGNLSPKENVAEQKLIATPNAQSAETNTVTRRRRRLKKRKIQKDTKTGASSKASKSVPPCIKGHKHEAHIPEESSNNFVIVAADDL